MKTITGYHFTADTLRDGQPIPPVGKWIVHDGEVVPCQSGLHCSEHPMDALEYAPGPMLHRVELRGGLQPHGDPVDKWVGRERRIVASIDATELLRALARWCAAQVADLWDAPEVVRQYQTTDDESLQANPWAAAMAARAARAAAMIAMTARNAAGAASAAAGAARAAMAAGDAGDAGDALDAQRAKFAAMVDKAFAKSVVAVRNKETDRD